MEKRVEHEKKIILFLVYGKYLMMIAFKLSIDISLCNENKGRRTTMVKDF